MFKVYKRFILIGVVFFALACSKKKEAAIEPETPGTKTTVKVMTYNIYGARPSFGLPPADLEAIAAVINEVKPDIVALQEIDVFTNRSGKDVHQARDLAKLTGMDWYFTKAIDRDGGQYGDAVLSKLPFLEKKAYNLNVAPGVSGELRSVAMVKVAKEGKEFYFASTHLDHLAIEDNRILQANELKKIVGDLNKPLILAGDFNAVPDSETMSVVRGFMNLGCRQICPSTYPASNPTRTIDYIMYSPINSFSIQSYRSFPYRDASDHAPVIADIEVK